MTVIFVVIRANGSNRNRPVLSTLRYYYISETPATTIIIITARPLAGKRCGNRYLGNKSSEIVIAVRGDTTV